MFDELSLLLIRIYSIRTDESKATAFKGIVKVLSEIFHGFFQFLSILRIQCWSIRQNLFPLLTRTLWSSGWDDLFHKPFSVSWRKLANQLGDMIVSNVDCKLHGLTPITSFLNRRSFNTDLSTIQYPVAPRCFAPGFYRRTRLFFGENHV